MMLQKKFVYVFIYLSFVSGAISGCKTTIRNDVLEDLVKVALKCPRLDHRDPYKKPAFFSLLTKTTDIGANSVVKFVDVKTNIGRAYNPNTGIFTTPRNGLYEFQTNFVSRGENWLELNLMKNNELVAKGHGAKDHGTSGSIRVLLELKNGDKVYLRNPRSYGGILAEKYSMFSGNML